MLVLLAPAYMGYAGGQEGWYQEMQANGATKLQAYGQYVANRFLAYDNNLWVHAGDYNPPDTNLMCAHWSPACARWIRDGCTPFMVRAALRRWAFWGPARPGSM